MKNLLLVLAFMLSIVAFAQNPIGPPTKPAIRCTLDLEFEPRCSPKLSFHGIYTIQICSSRVGVDPHETILESIHNYMCLYNEFPSYVTVKGFVPYYIVSAD